MTTEDLIAGVFLLSVTIFALTGGADFGGGVWTLLARGQRAEEHRQLVDRAIGPIWEANGLWLIAAIVILWTAFSPAFAAYGISLFIPFTLALVGIVLRGAFFAFRVEVQETSPAAYALFGKVFGAASLVTPVCFGLAAGAIASGRIRLANGLPTTGYVSPWLGPFPIIVGLLALVTCAYLAAVYLILEAREIPLKEDFRRRGIAASVALLTLGVATLPVAAIDAPSMWRGLTGGSGIFLMIAALLFLIASMVLLYRRSYRLARIAAILQLVAVFGAWGAAQYPYLLYPDVSLHSAAAPESTLAAILIVVVVNATVLGPSLWLLFRLFKRHTRGSRGH